MLLNLHVKNFALIREAEVEFTPGLNILTGETGAGKSILLGSVQLALGSKMSREMIRENAEYGLVELLFQTDGGQVEEHLKEMDIYPEDGQVLLSRKITEGRSVCRINGETCTLSQMKKAASYLLDVHGQHEHQSLLYKTKQLEILDEYGRGEILAKRDVVHQLYRDYKTLEKEASQGIIDEEQRKREIAFLEFEIKEIEEAAICAGEDEELEKQYRKLNNSKKIAEALSSIHQLTGYDQPMAAGEQVGDALRTISTVSEYDEQIGALEQTLGDIDGLLNDFNREISAYMDDFTFDDEDFYQIEKRLDLLNNLKGKYGNTLEDVLAYQKKQQEKLDYYSDYEENRKVLKEKLAGAEAALKKASGELSEVRRKYARALEQEVAAQLQDLNFLDVRFQIHFEETNDYTAGGMDDVEYLISTNPGEPLKSLSKVVSGGELSRIMLAIKTILADKDEVDTLIFDEIDTGISGRTAQKVSEKMKKIAASRQVICITHLPQIAAMADTHFEIAKTAVGQETMTKIQKLSDEDSTRELARLLSGAEVTDSVMKTAREMKELAGKQ